MGELPLHELDDAGPEARQDAIRHLLRTLRSLRHAERYPPASSLRPARVGQADRPTGTRSLMRRCGRFGRGFWFAESRRTGSNAIQEVTSSTLVSSTSNPVGNHRWGFCFSGVRSAMWNFGKPRSPVAKPRSLVAKPRSLVAKPRSLFYKPRSPVAKPRSLVAKPRSLFYKPCSLDRRLDVRRCKRSLAAH